jgi:hypothetical protein
VLLDPGHGLGTGLGPSTMRPFGRAHGLRDAPSWVMPGWMHGLVWALFQAGGRVPERDGIL